MLNDFFIPFVTILLAELGDKTQLAVFTLSTKTKKYYELLFGVILAFILADGLAILFGELITKLVPILYIKILSAIIFILFGIWILFAKDEKEDEVKIKTPFITGFSMVLLAEMGDKTQIASGLFATQFNPWLVFFGVILALVFLSVIAVFLGDIIAKRFNKKLISRIAGILFLMIGLSIFLSVWV